MSALEKMEDFAETLELIQANDRNYEYRYHFVMEAVARAVSLGYSAGFAIDPKEPDWPVAYIELPTGQVSWHMPKHPVPYDGHTTEEKYARLLRFVEGVNDENRPSEPDK